MRRVVLALSLLLCSSVWAADDPPGKQVVPSLGWSLDQVLDLTNAGTVTGTNVAFTDLLSCGSLTTDANGNLVCSPAPSGSGDITDVTAGAGLTGGASSGNATVDVGAGTAITVNANDVAVTADAIGATQLADDDFGDFTCADGGGGCLLDADTVGASEVAESASVTVANLTASSTVTGTIADISTNDIRFAAFASCTALETSSTGNLRCGTDDTGAGGGDAITVNASAATDPDFQDGDVDWTLTGGNVITATVGCSGCVDVTDMGADAVGSSEVIESQSYTVANLTATSTVTGAVVDISTADVRNTGWGAGFLKTDSGGNVRPTTSTKEFWWPCTALFPLKTDDAVPPPNKDAGTNVDQLVCGYDTTTAEARTGVFKVPSGISSAGTVTFRAYWYAPAATTGTVQWDFQHNSGVASGVDPDQTLTSELSTADTTAGTAGQITITTWTETLANLGWVANDLVYFQLGRNVSGDSLAEDANLIGFSVNVPEA